MKILIIFISLICHQTNGLVVNGSINFLFFGSSFADFTNTSLNFNFTKLKGSQYFDIKKPTAVYVHGYLTDYTTQLNKDLIKSYINRGDYNVIAIDWSKYSWHWNVYEVANSTDDQADYIRKTLLQMKSAGFDLNSFHFIGHCVGAHILGRVGNQFIEFNNITLSRITGLDPSAAFFETTNEWPNDWADLYPALNKKNAKFVDIIHTDAGYQGLNYVGGHVDFWPNGGTYQPKCSVFEVLATQADDILRCNHNRAVKYYTESVDSLKRLQFIATKCVNNTYTADACNGSISSMGIYASRYASNEGNFYLSTNGTSPYSTTTLILFDGGINLVFFGRSTSEYKITTLNYDFASLKGTKYFDTKKPTAVYAHGFNANFLEPYMIGIGAAFIERGDYNVIAVDWQKYTMNYFYPEVVVSINEAAAFIIQMLLQMQSSGYNLTSFYFIGHSMGAQMMGRLGYQFIRNYNFTPTRITGLDPAGPGFGDFNDWPVSLSLAYPCLNKFNAKFVDVIHTDAGGFGDSFSVAHADFWPNSGHDQPLCSIDPTNYVCDSLLDYCMGCDHMRALKYFAESVRTFSSQKFKSYLCPTPIISAAACTGNVSSMGFYADLYPSNGANYYLETNGIAPYSKSNITIIKGKN